MAAKEDTGVGKSMSLEIKRSLSYFQWAVQFGEITELLDASMFFF